MCVQADLLVAADEGQLSKCGYETVNVIKVVEDVNGDARTFFVRDLRSAVVTAAVDAVVGKGAAGSTLNILPS